MNERYVIPFEDAATHEIVPPDAYWEFDNEQVFYFERHHPEIGQLLQLFDPCFFFERLDIPGGYHEVTKPPF